MIYTFRVIYSFSFKFSRTLRYYMSPIQRFYSKHFNAVFTFCFAFLSGYTPLLPQPKRFCFHLCLFVCLFVSRITQKLLNQFSRNLAEMWRMGHRRKH